MHAGHCLLQQLHGFTAEGGSHPADVLLWVHIAPLPMLLLLLLAVIPSMPVTRSISRRRRLLCQLMSP
jgi:hypothetical protein